MIVRLLQFFSCQCFKMLTIMDLYLAHSFRDFYFLFLRYSPRQVIHNRFFSVSQNFCPLWIKARWFRSDAVFFGLVFFGAMHLCWTAGVTWPTSVIKGFVQDRVTRHNIVYTNRARDLERGDYYSPVKEQWKVSATGAAGFLCSHEEEAHACNS